MPELWRPQPVPSPLKGFLDTQEAPGAWEPEQPVNVRVRAPRDGEAAGDMLLELARMQPVRPPRLQEVAGLPLPGSAAEWGKLQEEQRFRVVGLTGTEFPRPATGWGDAAWADVIQDIPKSIRDTELPPAVSGGWALAAPGKDLVVSGPLMDMDRVLLYFVPALRHLRQQVSRRPCDGPSVLIVAGSFVTTDLKRLFVESGIAVTQLSGKHKSQKEHIHSDVAMGSVLEVGAVVEAREGFLRDISLIIVDDLAYNARSRMFAQLVSALPEHQWGQSLVWSPRWEAALEPAVKALTHEAAVLSLANSIGGVDVAHEVVEASQASGSLDSWLQRNPRLRVLVFANDPARLKEVLARTDTEGRLAAPETSSKKVVIVANDERWDGTDSFDLVVHVDAPGSRFEYNRRLACCRQLAATLVGLEDGVLPSSWVDFARYASAHGPSGWSGGSELRRLLQNLPIEKEPRKAGKVFGSVLERLEEMQKSRSTAEEDSADFQVEETGTLVWSAGVEELDTELAFLRGI